MTDTVINKTRGTPYDKKGGIYNEVVERVHGLYEMSKKKGRGLQQ